MSDIDPADPSVESAIDAFEEDLCKLINLHGQQVASHTPDYILASYLTSCLRNFSLTVTHRASWHMFHPGDDSLTGW